MVPAKTIQSQSEAGTKNQQAKITLGTWCNLAFGADNQVPKGMNYSFLSHSIQFMEWCHSSTSKFATGTEGRILKVIANDPYLATFPPSLRIRGVVMIRTFRRG